MAEIVERVKVQAQRLKDLEKNFDELRLEAIENSIDSILSQAENFNGTKIICHTFQATEMDFLRRVSDLIKLKEKSSIIVLGGKSKEGASILIAVTDDLVQKGIKANEMIKDMAALINGQGGGRPQLAQAGSKEVNKVENAVSQANRLIKEKIHL